VDFSDDPGGVPGVRRFDKFLSELNIAPNILADRLSRLIDRGILEKRKYQDLPERYEYRLTEIGKDLYGSLVAMMGWGDRWLSHGMPPIQLTHATCARISRPRSLRPMPQTRHGHQHEIPPRVRSARLRSRRQPGPGCTGRI